ncbi:PREDICTED: apolipoprotein F-like [Condylura cristata]|uniref:apolipoprotein F-like n=1 Tax=Condylura cristata TaxID=143302 RepID=UPI000643ADD4|nr:PREDICTED: apolipoprotein F-like [Condylura cristata]
MIRAVLLLCYVSLGAVAALPSSVQRGPLNLQPSFRGTGHPPNVLSRQAPLLDAKTCQYLLHTAPSLAPLPRYLSTLAQELALEEVGCSTEAHMLQLQLTGMGEKDTADTLREMKRHKEEGGAGDTQVVPRGLGVSAGEPGRVRRSVTLPEACKSDRGWVLFETAMLMVEFAEKLPPSELITEFKNAATQVTQQCSEESWALLEKQCERLIKSPEIQNISMPLEDQLYFVERFVALLIRIFLDAVWRQWQTYFG